MIDTTSASKHYDGDLLLSLMSENANKSSIGSIKCFSQVNVAKDNPLARFMF